MAAAEEKYRRLPGRRHGLVSGSSLWMGSDHILLVKSAWFREEYKRFYLRDIQAIVVAPCARFQISMPMLVFALVWLISGFFMRFWPAALVIGWIAGTLAMAAAWLAISLVASCRCRLYTAVSKDDLPSLYRTWTTRRFLRRLQPLIAQVQGTVDAGWAEAERSNAGPVPAVPAPVEVRPRAAMARSHTPASDLLVLSLVVSSLVGLATVHSASVAWLRVNSALNVAQLACAAAVMMQYSRGSVARVMQRLAIATLVLVGVMFYAQIFSYSFASAAGAFMARSSGLGIPRPVVVVNQAVDGVRLLLGVISAIVTLRGSYRDEPDIIKD
jgi:hypothetical protein